MKRYLINVLATQDLNEIADYFSTNNIDSPRRTTIEETGFFT